MIIVWKNWKVIEVNRVSFKGYDDMEQKSYTYEKTQIILQHRFNTNKIKTRHKPIEHFNVWNQMKEPRVNDLHDMWEK